MKPTGVRRIEGDSAVPTLTSRLPKTVLRTPATRTSPGAPGAACRTRYHPGMKHRALLALVFIFGCATGGVAAQLVVPPARAGSSPMRWEYECINVDTGGGHLTSELNQLGAQGWELASVVPGVLNFARTEVVTFVACSKRAIP